MRVKKKKLAHFLRPMYSQRCMRVSALSLQDPSACTVPAFESAISRIRATGAIGSRVTPNLCHWLANTSILCIPLDAARENATSILLCRAHAGCRSGQLILLYFRPVFCKTTTYSAFPSLYKRDTFLLVLGSATGVQRSIETSGARLILAPVLFNTGRMGWGIRL